jgi:hypothetical protein
MVGVRYWVCLSPATVHAAHSVVWRILSVSHHTSLHLRVRLT